MKQKITNEMAELCYKTAKTIFPDEEKISDSAKMISQETQMNCGSAKDYIKNFFSMIKGEKISHDMSERDTRYYFENIKTDFGGDVLKNALHSLQSYLICEKQNHPSLQKLINKFKEQIKL